MEFRLARINDSYDLSYLKKEVWETTYRGIYDDEVIDNYDYLKREEKFKNLISDINQDVYVCLDNNIIVGYMVVGIPLHEPLKGYELTINDLGIKKEYRGKGIGREFFNIVKGREKKFFNCCNYYNMNARLFYEKMGGKIVKTNMDDNKQYCQVYYVYD